MRGTLVFTIVCLTTAAAAASCSSSSSGASSASDAGASDVEIVDATEAPTLGGKILFRGLGEGLYFGLQIYADPVIAPGVPTLGDGHCDVHAPGNGDGITRENLFNAFPALDLGDTVTASNGKITLAASAGDAGTYQYEAALAGSFGFDTTFTLKNSGSGSGAPASTLATFRVPGRVSQQDASSPVMVGNGGPVTITYSGGDGAQSFHINISGSGAEIDCYPAPNTTSFTIPPNVVTHLDSMFTPIVWAESVTWVTVANRRVMLRVTSDNLD
jgi:hypothetical protein